MPRPTAVLALLVALAAGCSDDPPRPPAAAPSTTPTTSPTAGPASPGARTTPTVLVTGLEVPWGLAFLPDGSALVSERDSGRILRVTPDGAVSEADVVEEAEPRGEGGLLGLAVSPTYDRDRLVYAYYTTGEDNRIARFRLGERPQPIVTGIPAAGNHNGGRLAFGPDGLLYAGTGDASDRGLSQDPASLAGKVLRMRPDGSAPPDNPVRGSLVYSRGHRNVQGLAFDGAGRLWATEFGQSTVDEVNLIVAGGNYGWPDVEGTGGEPDYIDPLVTWSTADASPSGAAIDGTTLYVAALRGERLWRVPLDGDRAGTPGATLLGAYGRLRHVAVAPDGSLWLLTSNRDGRGDPVETDDRIVRLP